MFPHPCLWLVLRARERPSFRRQFFHCSRSKRDTVSCGLTATISDRAFPATQERTRICFRARFPLLPKKYTTKLSRTGRRSFLTVPCGNMRRQSATFSGRWTKSAYHLGSMCTRGQRLLG